MGVQGCGGRNEPGCDVGLKVIPIIFVPWVIIWIEYKFINIT